LGTKDFQETADIAVRKAIRLLSDDERNKHDKGKGKTSFQGSCHHCGKKGHKKADCYKLKNSREVEERGAVVLMAETTMNSEV
jgi:hypothetical protein